jgi:hypothetical protein
MHMPKRKAAKKRTARPRTSADVQRHVEIWKELAPPLEAKIAKAFRHNRRLPEYVASELAFHLADWIADLHELNELFARKRWNPVQAQRIISGFVVHVPNHLAAAHRILFGDPITDVFGLGAVKGTGRQTYKPGDNWRKAALVARAKGSRRKKTKTARGMLPKN